MIESFIDSALIIDDKKVEIEKLQSLLEERDIWVKYYHHEEFKEHKLKNRKIIFLDLSLDDSKSETENISTIIRPLFLKHIGLAYGTYGIVLWTNHLSKIEEFKSRIQRDKGKYQLPLFVVGLDKHKYLKTGNFNNIFEDLNKLLNENVAASFFIIWSSLVQYGKDEAIKNIYSSIESYDKQNENLRFILFQLARNLTGIPVEKTKDYPLHNDAFIAFNDMMNYEITKKLNLDYEFFKEPEKIKYCGSKEKTIGYQRRGNKEYFFDTKSISKDDPQHIDNINVLKSEIEDINAQINSKLLLEDYNLDFDNILPGNIYKILDGKSAFIINDKPNGSIPIVIEMTPKCDFSNKNNLNHKILAGYITDYDRNKVGKLKDFIYKDIYPIHTSFKSNPQMILFDFRVFGAILEDELKNQKKYQLILRAKDKLFADILQKLSSHIARLGLAIIH